MEKTQIVLDADVLIHFSKAERLSLLPEILAEYNYVILSTVYEEAKTVRQQLDNQARWMRNIRIVKFQPTGEMRNEYAILSGQYGRGESACMAYCKYTHNVIGSSNLRDITSYCQNNGITYLTTLDFLYYAFIRKIMTKRECHDFIATVNAKGSRLPNNIKIDQYKPSFSL